MKHWILIWAGLRRKPTRTVLTALSIVLAFLLFGLLHGVRVGLAQIARHGDSVRLFTANKYNSLEGMPISHMRHIAAVPGVSRVAPWVYFGGFYRDRRNAVGVFATDAPTLFAIYKEFRMVQGDLEALRRLRTGALITTQLAARYGWKVGDQVPMGTSLWPDTSGRGDYRFDIVGVYDRGDAPVNGFLVNYDYLDEARRFGTGTSHYYIVGLSDAQRADEVSRAIDRLFENSAFETRTQTEDAYLAGAIKQLADIDFVVHAIVGAVLFTLLFVTGNTMRQSVRERVPELAVLQAVGYTPKALVVLVLLESVFLCVPCSLVGLALARLAFVPLASALGVVSMPASVIATGMGVALMLAAVSGVPPALRVARRDIVDALAGR
jgi:putative ABC transport system permease protein